MFDAWCEVQSVAHVAKVCNVSKTTAHRYRVRDNWDSRFSRIEAKTVQRVETAHVNRNARQIQLAQLLQVRGAERLRVEGAIQDEGTAVRAVVEGIRIEREILKEDQANQDRIVSVQLPEGYEDIE